MPALWQCGLAWHLGRSRYRTINVLFAELPPLLRCLPLIPRDGKKRVAGMRSFNYYCFSPPAVSMYHTRRQASGVCGDARPVRPTNIIGQKKQKLMGESLERRLVHDSMIEFRASEAVQQQEQAAHL